MSDVFTARERCGCGAEYELSGPERRAVMDGVRLWMDRHRKRGCSASPQLTNP